jgi:methylmalonyl-CoA decarboxylase
MPLVLSELLDRVGTIAFDHDVKRNALSSELIAALVGALERHRADGARAVVLRARKGSRVWSAGHDVAELPRSGRDPLAYSDSLEQGIRAIRNSPMPVLALVDGSVWGGAVELALCCDLRIGTPAASFALTPVKLGVPYNPAGILRIMNALPARLVNEMFFTALPVSGERALATGILNHLVPDAEVEAFTYGMAAQIAEYSPLSIAVIKEQLRLLRNAAPLSPETFERIQGLRRSVYDSRDYQEGREAFLQKRRPVFRGE